MSSLVKLAVVVLVAVMAGLVVGFFVGTCGKAEVAAELGKAQQQLSGSMQIHRRQLDDCQLGLERMRGSRELVLAKEHLLRAAVEMVANNYGLASQQLGECRARMKNAEKGLDDASLAKLRAAFEKTAQAQTLVMRLDPMARVQIDQILGELQELPGAR